MNDKRAGRKRAEKSDASPVGGRAIRRSQALAAALLESASQGVLAVDREGGIAFANATLEAMFGYATGELVGQQLEILLPEALRSRHVGLRVEYFAAPRPRPMGIGLDLAGRRKDGSEFPVEISLSHMQADEDALAVAFVIDISRRKEAELRLSAELAVTRALAEAPTLSAAAPRLARALVEYLGWEIGELWQVDPDDGALRRRGAWYRPGLDVTEFERLSAGLAFAPGEGLPGRVLATGEPAWIPALAEDASVTRRDAVMRLGLHSALACPMRYQDRITGVMLFIAREIRRPIEALIDTMRDMGSRIGEYIEHQRTREELDRQRAITVQSEKLAALGTLAAGLAHEMNNPLGIMSSRIDVMLMEAEEQKLPAQLVEDLRVLHRNTLRVTRVAAALRSFGRQAGNEREPLHLNTVVEETLLLARKPLEADGIAVTTALVPDLPVVVGDAGALQQVVLNLLTNAREAMAGRGSVHIETGRAPDRPGWVRLVVTDTGPGISPEHVPRIFDPFYTTKPTGTGLGLALSYGIIKDHAGTVDVHSEPGKGTTFVLGFPAAESGREARPSGPGSEHTGHEIGERGRLERLGEEGSGPRLEGGLAE